jgi:hypothetical protein
VFSSDCRNCQKRGKPTGWRVSATSSHRFDSAIRLGQRFGKAGCGSPAQTSRVGSPRFDDRRNQDPPVHSRRVSRWCLGRDPGSGVGAGAGHVLGRRRRDHFVMGLGTAITMATIAVIAVSAKDLARPLSGASEGRRRARHARPGIRCRGAVADVRRRLAVRLHRRRARDVPVRRITGAVDRQERTCPRQRNNPYSITASAPAIKPSGISRASALAVLRLITSSKRAS